MRNITLFLILPFFLSCPLAAQKTDNAAIASMVQKFKSDQRGPYKDIRWFCRDGSFSMPKEPCAEPGGVQRARYKDEVDALAKSSHIFLGQILSTTPIDQFWDVKNYHSRLKQYQLEKYLKAIDDGWVLRKGQYYRGAFQAEDEEAWGIAFFNSILATDDALNSQFFLVRQAVKDIPHRGDDSKTLNIRAVSKMISDTFPSFMDLRVKIHGQPDAGDIALVKAFRDKNRSRLDAYLQKKFDVLLADMEEVYKPVDVKTLNRYAKVVSKDTRIGQSLHVYLDNFPNQPEGAMRAMATAAEIAEIRQDILLIKSTKARLALLDLSNALEEILFKDATAWETTSVLEAMEKIYYLGLAAWGTGFIEDWEWEELSKSLIVPTQDTLTLDGVFLRQERARSLVEWGTGMVRGTYKDAVNLFGGFEPLTFGFYDDRIRGSVLLNLGQTVGLLGDFVAREAFLSNHVLGLSNQSSIRGLNPGFAMGELVVVSGNEEEIEVSKDKIYVFNHPPSDLKPIAGIATVTEGNMVSHVQLLARNLGIPNAVVSSQNLEQLQAYSGQKVFYAVSNKGTVIMKPIEEMTLEEQQLFAVKVRSEEKISVPVEKIDLTRKSTINLREVNATSSGKLCGPKAANLGQLKLMFPENVVEGMVISFGIFREHLNQPMPGQASTYWEFLNQTFQKAEAMREAGQTEEDIEAFSLKELETLRNAIKQMPLLPGFITDLETNFESILGKPMGKVPVFLRSDTNMEDLKDFTGAGLNLTLFNVVEREKIMQGIKEVWASPYTERSFKWRQRYLLNPENVYPSILIIPSVDVDYSGVLITKGLPTGDDRDLTIAFSLGAGGAVDGQAAESYLLNHQGQQILLSPAREPSFRRLPETGGTSTLWATFERPILQEVNLEEIRNLSAEVREKLPQAPGIETKGPFDVELGFKDNKLWLFQVRPFVENKNAMSSTYLESISPKIEGGKKISLTAPITALK